MLKRLSLLVAVTAIALAAAAPPAEAATCADHANQAAAQAAADTRDADGDGIYCESLPCPCSTGQQPAPPPTPASPPPAPPEAAPPAQPQPEPNPAPVPPPPAPTPVPAPTTPQPAPGCKRPSGIEDISFSATKYPTIRRHFLDALRAGWPRTLILNRVGADARRDRLLTSFPTRPGFDRDEYPPALGRGRGSGLTRGTSPVGWRGDVAYVPSSENRSHGSTLGSKFRRFCDGTRFRYVFY